MPEDDDEPPTAPRTPSALLRAAQFEAELERMRKEHEAKIASMMTPEWREVVAALLVLVKPQCGLCKQPATRQDDIVYRCDECAGVASKTAVDLPHAWLIRRALAMVR